MKRALLKMTREQESQWNSSPSPSSANSYSLEQVTTSLYIQYYAIRNRTLAVSLLLYKKPHLKENKKIIYRVWQI